MWSVRLVAALAGINIVHIAYKGISAAVLDLIGGRIEAMFSTVPSVLPSYKRLTDQGFQVHVMPAEQFVGFVRSERAKWAKVVKAIGIPPQ